MESQKAAEGDAPPKQVAMAMERLGQAARLIADLRLAADSFLEAILSIVDSRFSSDPDKSIRSLYSADSSMRLRLHHLRTLGKQLEESGVQIRSLKSRGDSWGLHMPLVCPDSTVVAYAWKRQLAGQAGASAVDRTRLALRAFTEQKRRFFPHLEESGTESDTSKRHRAADPPKEGLCVEAATLSDVLTSFEKGLPDVKIFTYQRLDWFKRASSLSPNTVDQNLYGKSTTGPLGSNDVDQVAVVELFVPFVFRAVLSLHPAGSVNPASVSFFSPDEGGKYIHSRGSSVHNVFKHITDHAGKALQYFQSAESDKALHLLLHWIYGYHTLYAKVCSKCRRLVAMDSSMGLLLPPVYHPYQQCSPKLSSDQSTILANELPFDQDAAYHFGCYSNKQ